MKTFLEKIRSNNLIVLFLHHGTRDSGIKEFSGEIINQG